ncbi:MAG: alpha/beta hydrolase [Lachnospiraceae bacterium]|nr:alpha/beta hydrolase [Lachnospiraceae bacterium]
MMPVLLAGIPVLLGLLALYVVYRICFWQFRPGYTEERVEYYTPSGEAYEPYREVIEKGIHAVMDAKEYEMVEVISQDGLKLSGRYYHRKEGAPLVIFMHGYKGNFYRDGNGIFSFSRRYGFNVLLVHQRAHGCSEGKTITFGIKERYDCKTWAEYAAGRFGADQKILISGLSMGAATVMMAADVGLPEQVKGIMADCGFSSPKEILCSVMERLKLPSKLMYPMAKLAARLYGGFDLEEASAVESLRNCTVPVLLIHGEGDDFVPSWMSVKCREACASDCRLLLVPGIGHGMSYCHGPREYEAEMERFFLKTLGVRPIS